VLAGVLILWLAVDRSSGSKTASAPSTVVTASSAAELESLVASIGHWVFWVGPKSGTVYELSRLSDGTVKIRYLPSGAQAGSTGSYLTVATYPFLNPFFSIQELARQPGSTSLAVPGGVGSYTTGNPDDVHLAYPGVDYQIEVFDPAGSATSLVSSGQVAPVSASQSPVTTPKAAQTSRSAVSIAGLEALSAELGHAIYWVGPRKGYTYELTRLPSGELDIRYLPPGATIGAPEPYLTVATYRFSGALEALRALEGREDEVAIELPGGGLAVLDRKHPTSIHLAYPGVDSQVEVYSPSPTAARRLVETGQVRPVG
jgi:hypothetical protein